MRMSHDELLPVRQIPLHERSARNMSSFTVSLSRLVPNKRNPRRAKPDRDAHRRLIALIERTDFCIPLWCVRLKASADTTWSSPAIVGSPLFARSIAVLVIQRFRASFARWMHRRPMLCPSARTSAANPCIRWTKPKRSQSWLARMARMPPPSHQSSARPRRYVRQRIKLATLAESIKIAYRASEIDTSISEAFASVPPERQLEVWKEVDGHPRHAEHVRNVIAHNWIDAKLAYLM